MTNYSGSNDPLRRRSERALEQTTQGGIGPVPKVDDVALEDVLGMGAAELEALVPALEVLATEVSRAADEAVAAAADAIAIAAATQARLGALREREGT